MNETLKQYMLLVKENSSLINGPDYPGKEKDIRKQKEQIDAYAKKLQQGFSTDDDYDEFADAVIKCAYGDISLEELETVYNELISPS
ncbi:YnfE family protein [Bacillus glycinifermentans]|uniref:YnfE family protein n=1 Tax=Bacillus glycinifermentans TaxID=1664069 RepID=UPI0022E8B138|nr:YnfE family protein [Bacillus glycinifermentans]